MAERIVLDPAELGHGRTELDVTPWIKFDGLDWGDAEITAYMAEQQRGSTPIDYRVPNRAITGPLQFVDTVGGTTTAQARAKIQAKMSMFQREGGWLKRVTNGGGTVYADIVNATFHATSVSGWASATERDTEASFALEAIPDFYGAEVSTDDIVETSAAEIAGVLEESSSTALIEGDFPARCRIVVDEDDGENQLGLLWGFRSRHYSAAATAALAYEAEALQPVDTSAGTALAGASGGTVVTHSNLGIRWTQVLGTNIGGTTFLTHTGTYRVWARVYSTSGTAVALRFAWDVGDLLLPVENPQVTVAGSANFYLADLGEVHLAAPPIGTYRWQGVIEAKGAGGGENVSIDKLWFQPLDESAGRLSVPPADSTSSLDIDARDEFNQTAGSLTGKNLLIPSSQAWAVGAGVDADDFTINTTLHAASRTAQTDTAPRIVQAGTTVFGDVMVQLDFRHDGTFGTAKQGIVLRYVDINNFLVVTINLGSAGSPYEVAKYVAGVKTVILSGTGGVATSGAWYSMKLSVEGANVFYYQGVQGVELTSPVVGSDSDLAAGGALDDGKVGIYDYASGAAGTRLYDNFTAWTSPTGTLGDAVLFASQSAELRYDGIYREDSSGSAYGPMSVVVGDLPRLPPSGLEARPVELFVKATRGDFDALPDAGIDDISARVSYWPSYPFIP